MYLNDVEVMYANPEDRKHWQSAINSGEYGIFVVDDVLDPEQLYILAMDVIAKGNSIIVVNKCHSFENIVDTDKVSLDIAWERLGMSMMSRIVNDQFKEVSADNKMIRDMIATAYSLFKPVYLAEDVKQFSSYREMLQELKYLGLEDAFNIAFELTGKLLISKVIKCMMTHFKDAGLSVRGYKPTEGDAPLGLDVNPNLSPIMTRPLDPTVNPYLRDDALKNADVFKSEGG